MKFVCYVSFVLLVFCVFLDEDDEIVVYIIRLVYSYSSKNMLRPQIYDSVKLSIEVVCLYMKRSIGVRNYWV